MNTAASTAGATTEPTDMPEPHGISQANDGRTETLTPCPLYTLTSATTDMAMRTRTSMLSRAYCNRAEISMPR